MKVLVVGSTGKQGGHVAKLLLKKGHAVNALTRKPNSSAAKELEHLGAHLIIGDLEDPKTIERAVGEVDTIFGMTTMVESGLEAEIKQGTQLANAAKIKGKYLVYSSIAFADKKTGIPHFDSKYKIEQQIKQIGVDAAIIAPVYFMENILMTLPQLKDGMFASPLTATRKLQQIAVDDIAAFAVLALENKSRFVGKRIDIASEEITGEECAKVMTKVLGKPIKYYQVPMMFISMLGDDMVKMFQWFEKEGFHADIAGLRRDYPEVGWHSYEQWAKEQHWEELLHLTANR